MDKDKVSIEEAINRAGFGLYSYILTSLAGVTIICFVCISYGSTILVPTSACELETTASQQGLLAAAPVIGSIIGVIIWGYLADTRGRRSMLILALVGGGVFNTVASISVNWIMLMLLQLCASLFSSGIFSMSMSLLSESVPMVKRNLVVLLVSSIFLLSQGIMAVLAIPIIPLSFSHYIPFLDIYWNSWRLLLIVYSIPSFLSAIWLYFMQESPKYVFSMGDEPRALEILKIIHKVNHMRSGQILEVNNILSDEVQEDSGQSKNLIKELFRMPLLKYTIIMMLLLMFKQVGAFLVWLPKIADQFVRILQTGEGSDLPLCGIIESSLDISPVENEVPCALDTLSLLMVLAVAATQSVVNFVLSLIVNHVGRRNLAMCVVAVCGIAGIVTNLIPNAIGSAVVFSVLLQGMVVLGMYTAIIVAIFPTHLRALAIAFPLLAGRVATFASIQILNHLLINNCNVGFYVFSAILGSSAVLLSFLPDDRRPPPLPSPSTLPGRAPETPALDNVKELHKNVSQL